MTEAQPETAKKKRGAKKAPPRFSREQPDVRRAMLIEAATRCLSVGGIGAFTVDRICKEAGVSRGLINHHFEGRDGSLVEVYKSSLYASVNNADRRGQAPPRRDFGLAAAGSALPLWCSPISHPIYFSRDNLLIWLSLWGEIAVNPRLKAAHRELYDVYRAELAEDIAAVATPRGRDVDAAGAGAQLHRPGRRALARMVPRRKRGHAASRRSRRLRDARSPGRAFAGRITISSRRCYPLCPTGHLPLKGGDWQLY